MEARRSMLFGETYRSGKKAPASGIYRCTGCNRKITVPRGRKLPPCDGEWELFHRTTKSRKKKAKGILDTLFG